MDLGVQLWHYRVLILSGLAYPACAHWRVRVGETAPTATLVEKIENTSGLESLK
jgi:hypothetical protein